ncbi:hypothetical protein KC19_3G238500 [Ceratodon purpureus]|uniref:DUF4216 domain-containing protein n=1 Tax=Ceratodon purpureus TaxID=3225 RepID=A0A8T0INS6_CERPU|nr:hypothetical protein KC19_3G238500 [Ceratodon purpureus]
MCRRYQVLVEERNSARLRWRGRHQGRNGSRGPNFPAELAEYPVFSDWLRDTVVNEIEAGQDVDSSLEALAKFPRRRAKKYRSLYAYGYHLRVRSAEADLKTCNSGIAATFIRRCRYGLRDRNPVLAALEYVGYLDEIIDLDYGEFHQTVLVGSWVKANYRGPQATVRRDKWGLTVANFNRMIEYGIDSFAFPNQVEQVFYADCNESPGWKVVIRTEPRGRRVTATSEEDNNGLLFSPGRDADFAGLRVLEDEAAEPETPTRGGRVIRVDDFYAGVENDNTEVYDRDIGESSEEE